MAVFGGTSCAGSIEVPGRDRGDAKESDIERFRSIEKGRGDGLLHVHLQPRGE